MEMDVSFYRTVRLKSRPSASTGWIAFVVAVPCEFPDRAVVDRRFQAIRPTLDGDESKIVGLVGAKLDERRSDEINGVSSQTSEYAWYVEYFS